MSACVLDTPAWAFDRLARAGLHRSASSSGRSFGGTAGGEPLPARAPLPANVELDLSGYAPPARARSASAWRTLPLLELRRLSLR